ncbi:hypothetical protein VTN77DRAFT_1206 [Rasamsonia byssochlamydoides]|uniref:uncharacterized protein n=1 Tax=Rasamsonia byssochlamydoides TaxID=89139 RepID=UPI003742C196
MRLTSPLLQKAAFQWLSSLKTAELKSIAQATGVREAGPKAALRQRLIRDLQRSEFLLSDEVLLSGSQEQSQGQDQQKQPPPRRGANGRDLSILSIDMGIQNLAFAHFLVPAPGMKSLSLSFEPKPTLNAWHRLAVLELPTGSSTLPPEVFTTLAKTNNMNNKDKNQNPQKTTEAAEEDISAEEEELNLTKAGMFSMNVYAAQAYTLVASLIAAYQPTHILIEKQRFRSGGRPAIQEWTLRVGVFEGMLHAVLHTLQQLGKCSVEAQRIDPKRVVRYWNLEADDEDDANKKKKGKTKGLYNEVKKRKIDLVGRWLQAAREGGISESQQQQKLPKVDITELLSSSLSNSDARDVVNAYLYKWNSRRLRTALDEPGVVKHLDKLDDLADCLLQGMTWLQWQIMRARVAREGLGALNDGSTNDSGSGSGSGSDSGDGNASTSQGEQS